MDPELDIGPRSPLANSNIMGAHAGTRGSRRQQRLKQIDTAQCVSIPILISKDAILM